MKPVEMLIKHDAEKNQVGDCFRCSIASVLELPGEDVPHFMELDWDHDNHRWAGGQRGYLWYPALQRWLQPRGLAYFEIQVPEAQHGKWFANLEPHFDVFHTLGGMSPRDSHCVVARNGVMVHDPAPQKTGLIGPTDDGMYTYGFLILRGAS